MRLWSEKPHSMGENCDNHKHVSFDSGMHIFPFMTSTKMTLLFCMVVVAYAMTTFSPIDARPGEKRGNMILKTNAFKQSETIPQKYTCDGADISPDLSWEGAPKGTKSFALICDDPDAPSGTFTHWVLYALPSSVTGLSENLSKNAEIHSPEGKQGTNGFGKVGYGGPCPPRGSKHRYFFKLYALDSDVQLSPKASKEDLESSMKGHVLAQGELMGTYQRK